MKRNKYNNSVYLILSIALFVSPTLNSCRKLVEVDPPSTKVTGDNAYSANNTAAAVMTGLYAQLAQKPYPTITPISLSIMAGLSADELNLVGNVTTWPYYYYTNSLFAPLPPASGGGGYELWSIYYYHIFICNSIIEGATASSSLTPAVKQQLLGEAKFMRSFYYFYLVNLYGDVPLALTSDYKVNTILSKTPKSQVYQQIIQDLKDAEGLLSPIYLSSDLLTQTSDRFRPTKWAAAALLARVYLYTNDFTHAEEEATSVINNTGFYDIIALNSVFLKNSKEAIWQLQNVTANMNSQDGMVFVLPASGPSTTTGNPVYLSNFLLNAFDSGDNRKTNWIKSVIAGSTYYYPYKYKLGKNSTAGSEPQMMFRLAEQYLIRAEARANGAGTGLSGAIADVSKIRTRAGLSVYNGPSNKDSIMKAVLHERQVELFTEMGQRWLDLKRTNSVDSIMKIVAPQKAQAVWKSYQQWYPLPYDDIQKDPNLVQNDEY